VDVSGFRPEEINVEMQGNEIIVRGEHKEQNDSK
jgi:HSP20 family molecular chaperone IbpA